MFSPQLQITKMISPRYIKFSKYFLFTRKKNKRSNCGPKEGRWVCKGLLIDEGDLLLVGGLLGQKNSLDVGQHSSLGDGHTRQKFVQLFVVTDGQLEMARVDSGLLVVTGSVSGQLENLSSEVFENGSEVDGGSSSDTLGIVTLAEHTVKTTDGELKTGTRRARLGLSTRLGFSSLSASRHGDSADVVDLDCTSAASTGVYKGSAL